MAGLFSKGVKGAKELAEFAGLDKKAAAYLKRLTQRVKEAKTPKGKKLAKEKLMQKEGAAIIKGVSYPKNMKSGGKVYKVDNSGQQIVAKQYGGKVK